MKKTITFSFPAIFVILCFLSCEKEGISRYNPERAGIEFDGKEYIYSFKKTGKSVDTLEIPFKIEGPVFEMDREANIIAIPDSTTATADQYRLLKAVVPARSFEGKLQIRIENKVGNDFKDVDIYLQTADNEDFVAGVEEYKNYRVTVTNRLVRPYQWDLNGWKEKYFLGNYSTAYYEFIIEATGETEFPYPWAVPGYHNDQVWSGGEKDAFLAKLKDELRKRNQRVGKPLLHDDGPCKGLEVVIGKYYNI